MFVRIKKIAGNEYAYLTESKWTAKGPRQHDKKYLGRIFRPQKTSERPVSTIGESFESNVHALIATKLRHHGFQRTTTSKL